ncbi:hypothetical protein [Lacunimicrobium album]
MANEVLMKKIRDVLKSGYFKDENDLVDVSNGESDDLHVVIVSRKLDGKRLKVKQDLIWSDLLNHLSKEECGQISLSIGVSPEEIKAG